MKRIHVPPLGWFENMADLALVPLMYVVSGTLSESPQRTHRWNHVKLSADDIAHLNTKMMVHSVGDRRAVKRQPGKLPFFHLPLLGGWVHYLVVGPQGNQAWHVGWSTKDLIGVTRITLRGPVRVLLGPKPVSFFGIDRRGNQIPLARIGRGRIGDEGTFSRIPLL